MRPSLRFLSDELIEQIIAEARGLLCNLGVELHNPELTEMLAGYGGPGRARHPPRALH